MIFAFWVDGHLSWVFFGIIVYTVVGILAADVAWRLVRIRVFLLLPAAFALWCIGVLLGLWVGLAG